MQRWVGYPGTGQPSPRPVSIVVVVVVCGGAAPSVVVSVTVQLRLKTVWQGMGGGRQQGGLAPQGCKRQARFKRPRPSNQHPPPPRVTALPDAHFIRPVAGGVMS